MLSSLLLCCMMSFADSLPPLDTTLFVPRAPILSDTQPRRPRPVTYSDAYFTRLTIHRWGSYTMLPLFAAEVALGQNLINDSRPPSWIKSTHVGVALGIGALFTSNTVTGVWNLWESRKDPAGRTRRLVHSALMIASDAGFVATGLLAEDAGHSVDGRNRHRTVALTSMGVAAVGGVMMWFWKD
jgi:hypothetical protein